MANANYSVGKSIKLWNNGAAQSITFIVTDDCNLRCKYCYVTHKCADKKMSFETGKKIVDYMLTADIQKEEAVILDFIGGEPLLEAELIDKICDYFKIRAFELNHPWYWNYRINICTNGVNYASDAVQNLIKKNYGKISVSISIDGTKEKHDMQRVFPDGTGSYDSIKDNIDLWLSQFPGFTKMTFASDDLPLLKDSVLELWNMGITHVASNVVFENVWKENDDKVLEQQLMALADYVIDNHLFDKGYVCTFFDESLGFSYEGRDFYQTFCGAGKMLAFSSDGRIFPCMRYYGHSLNNHDEWAIGDLEHGIDMEKVRAFTSAAVSVQSDDECLNCEIAWQCPFCQGFNYDSADTPTNFQRAKYICNMHKARVRANNYYFAKLKNIYGITREVSRAPKKSLYIPLNEDYITYCCYDNKSVENRRIPEEIISEALKYAHQNFMRPVFVHSKSVPKLDIPDEYNGYDILHIMPAEFFEQAQEKGIKDILPVYNVSNVDRKIDGVPNCVLNIQENELDKMADAVISLLSFSNRVNLNVVGLSRAFDEVTYTEQLVVVKDYLVEEMRKGVFKELNVLTDICMIHEHSNCQAGENSFYVDFDGDLYACPAFASLGKELKIGNAVEGITRKYNSNLYKISGSSICRECDAYHCQNCVFTNYTNTKEVNVSPSFQCRKSHLERKVSIDLLKEIKKNPQFSNYVEGKEIPTLEYLDPIKSFLDKSGGIVGTYKYKEN